MIHGALEPLHAGTPPKARDRSDQKLYVRTLGADFRGVGSVGVDVVLRSSAPEASQIGLIVHLDRNDRRMRSNELGDPGGELLVVFVRAGRGGMTHDGKDDAYPGFVVLSEPTADGTSVGVHSLQDCRIGAAVRDQEVSTEREREPAARCGAVSA